MAKSFKAKASNVGAVYNDLLPDTEANKEQEALEAQEAMKTQGRKGMKALRMSMAFTPSNSDYIRVMAGTRGKRMTTFVNEIIAEARERDKNYTRLQAVYDAIRAEEEE